MEHCKPTPGPPAGDGVLSSTAQTANPAGVTFKATIPGVYTLRLTTNDPAGSCVAVSDDLVITVEQGATVNAGTDTPICSGTTYTLAGSSIGGSATNGTWSIVSQPVAPPAAGDGVLSVTTATTTPATVTFKATVAGTYTLRLTTDDPTGSCGAVTDDVVITVGGVATVNAGLDNDICAGDVPALAGSFFGGSATSATWTITSGPTGPGTGDGVLSVTTATTTPDKVTFTATIEGPYTLTLTTNDPAGACGAVSDDVIVTVFRQAVANAGSPKAVCPGGALTLNTASIGGSATTGAWSIVSQPAGPPAGDGVLSTTAQTTTPNTVTFTATIPGTYRLRLTTDDPNGPCQADTDEVVITVDNVASADAGQNKNACSGDATTLTGALVGGSATTGAWSIVSQPADLQLAMVC